MKQTTTNGTLSLIEEEQTLHPFTQLQAKDYYNIQFFDGNHKSSIVTMTTKQLNLLRVSLDLVPGAFQFIPKRPNHSENVGTIWCISQSFHFGTIANLRTIPKNFGTISNLRTIRKFHNHYEIRNHYERRNFFTNGGLPFPPPGSPFE